MPDRKEYSLSLFAKAFLINCGATAGTLIATVQTIVLSRVLGPHSIGQYALAVSMLSLGSTVFAFGYPLSFLYFAKQPHARKNDYFTAAFIMLSLIGLIGGILFAGLFYTLRGYFGDFKLLTLFAIAVYSPLALLRVLFRNHLLVDIQAKKITLVELIAVGCSAAMVLAAWMLDRLTVDVAVISFVAATTMRALVGWTWIRKEISFSPVFGLKLFAPLSRMGAKQLWPDLVIMANEQIGIILLKLLLDGFDEVGFYSRALSISMLFNLASQAVMPVLFSRWAELSGTTLEAHIEKVLRFATTFSLGLALGLIAWGEWIVVLLYGPTFIPAVPALRILSIGAACAMLNRTFMQLLGGRGMPEKGTFILSTGFIVSAIANMALIPWMGMVGCATASAGAQLMMTFMFMAHARKFFQLKARNCALINRRDWLQFLNSLRMSVR